MHLSTGPAGCVRGSGPQIAVAEVRSLANVAIQGVRAPLPVCWSLCVFRFFALELGKQAHLVCCVLSEPAAACGGFWGPRSRKIVILFKGHFLSETCGHTRQSWPGPCSKQLRVEVPC